MNKEGLKKELRKHCTKEKNISELSNKLKINEYEILCLVRELRTEGINIITKVYDDNLYLYDNGERENKFDYSYDFYTDENNEFKFVAISDTRFGSVYQQLSILNDIYTNAYENGYMNVIHCGNISEGIYPISNIYNDTVFLDDTMRQVDYIARYYPKIEGMKTYFITSAKDETHLKKNKINIGKRISSLRNDMIYLGFNSCNLKIDNTSLLVFNAKLGKTYTVSYRSQQQIDSFRSEDKPDILLYGGLLQMEKFNYRDVVTISVPSVCATTKEMIDKRYSNTVGAWYITIKTDSKGNLESIKACDSIYYSTINNDYQKPKVLKLSKGDCNNE